MNFINILCHGRSAEIRDILIDIFGAISGVIIIKLILKIGGNKMNKKMNIPFSPPDVGEEEIKEVVEALKSGWITTGPKTKLFEQKITDMCHTERTVCLNSSTAAMEMTLRLLGIGEGDEVITTAYTYTASCSVICHVGATPVLVDIQENNFEMDY